MSTKIVKLEDRDYTLTFEATGALAGISYIDASGRRRELSVNGKVAKQVLATLEVLEPDPREATVETEAYPGQDEATPEERAYGGAAGGGKIEPPPHPSFMRIVKRAWQMARAINTTNALMKSRPKNAVELRELLGVGNPQYDVPKFRHPTPERMPAGRKAGSYGRGLMNHFANERLKAFQRR